MSQGSSTAVANSEPGTGNLLIGYVLLGLQPIFVVLLTSSGFSAADTVFVRFFLSTVAISSVFLLRHKWPHTGNLRVLVARGLFGGVAVLLYFSSIQHAGAARGTLLNYTYPLWANLIGWLLGTRPPRGFWPGFALAFAGVWLVVLPEGGWGDKGLGWGELAGLLSAVLGGISVLAIKKLRETDESLTIILSFSVFGLLLSTPLVDFTRVAAGAGQPSLLLPIVMVGATSLLGHLFFTRGYRGASLAQATLLSLLVPLIAVLVGLTWLGESFNMRFLLGSSLIAAALMSAMAKQLTGAAKCKAQ